MATIFDGAVTELGLANTAVLALGGAGMLIFVGVRAFHWAKGALS